MSRADESTTISRGAWIALVAALLGWMFDGLEMGLFPMLARPALNDLLGPSGKQDVGLWMGIMFAVFLVGAATGGVVFGWLGDRIGRVRAMTLSVLTYSVFMGLCGVSSSVHQMFVFRFVSALGMGGEWSLGVALVMEIWPNRTRGVMAGLIGAAANVGFLVIGVVGLGLSQVIGSLQAGLIDLGLSQAWVSYLVADTSGGPTGWRLLLLFGAAPALLTFFIRLVVPESQRWLKAKAEAATSHWAGSDMLAIVVGGTGPLGIIYLWSQDFSVAQRISGTLIALAVAVVGYTFPVLRYLQRSQAAAVSLPHSHWSATISRMLLGACLSGVPLIGTWASIQNAPSWADQLVERSYHGAPPETTAAARSAARSWTQIAYALGAIAGTIVAALMGDRLGRRLTYALLCIGSLVSLLAFFQLNTTYGTSFLAGVFVAGGLTASFYGWLPLYLPELFPTSVRATCQGFSYNFGRILAAIGALQTGYLMKDVFHEDYARACSLMSLAYVAGLAVIWFAPETRGQPLPD
ncbi:MAG: MFS transporter [Planctomycetes bacterium]|nr:MFS transporter [Planctomycetota bacterium]